MTGAWSFLHRGRPRVRVGLRVLGPLALAAALCGGARAARAEPPRFLGEVDRNQVTVGEPFVYQVTLSVNSDQISDYRPPDFKGLRVLSRPAAPNQSTQMQFGAAGMFVEASYSWRYEVAATQKGSLNIGPARVRVNGQEFRSSVVTISAGAAGAAVPAPPPPTARNGGPAAAAPPPGQTPPEAAAGGSFIRLVTDKPKAFVGEAITTTWFLYMDQPHDKYDTQVEPTMEGFWTEDIAIPNHRGGMVLTEELVDGRPYQVGAVLKKVLFPLQAGRLTVTAMEAQLSRTDFFGTAVRNEHVRSTPSALEILPLPKSGQPAGFDPANVGAFTLTAHVDRAQVAVGEAVTLTVELAGTGNLRKVAFPALPKLAGWKSYEPRVNVVVDPATGTSGTKTAEILLLPERAGVVTLPALVLDFFNPTPPHYARAVTTPLTLTVTGDAGAGAGVAAADQTGTAATGPGPAAATGTPIENVIADEIRPIHARAGLRRDLGATFFRTRAFTAILLAPPLALAFVFLAFGLRDRMAEDTGARRRRVSRRKVRAHFSAAEEQRRRGDVAAFFIELDRVIREALSDRLGQPVAGLRMDELRAQLGRLGLPPSEAERVVGALEECDRARFAPGSVAGNDADLGAALERATEIVAAIEKAERRPEGSA